MTTEGLCLVSSSCWLRFSRVTRLFAFKFVDVELRGVQDPWLEDAELRVMSEGVELEPRWNMVRAL